MSRKIILSLPTRNVEASKGFFQTLGFTINAAFSDQAASLLEFSEHISVMLMSYEKFREFAPPGSEIVDATKSTQVLISLSLASKDEVNSLADAASRAGATTFEDAEDHGFMYARSFQDLDGHGWQLMWVDESAVPAAS